MNPLNKLETDKDLIKAVVNRYMGANYSHLTGDSFDHLRSLLMTKSLDDLEYSNECVADRDLDRWVFETILDQGK